MLQLILFVLLIVVLALAALVLWAALTGPDRFHVERSTVVEASPESLYPLVADFQQWQLWSPYEGLDADLQRRYGGAPSGLGATYGWDGRKAGSGTMEIVRAEPPSGIGIRLDFTRPFRASNVADFSFMPDGARTRVTWAMHGRNTLVSKLFQTFVSMDRIVGRDFERGLEKLKATAEQRSPDRGHSQGERR